MKQTLETIAHTMVSGERIGTITTQINIGINRQLTPEEQRIISRYDNEISNMLFDNSYHNHPDTVKEVLDERRAILNCFPPGMVIYVEEIPSMYGPKGNPAYQITTHVGRIKIGWRKRVIQIDWSDSISQVNAYVDFFDDDVTKETKMIHAYGYEKAKQYLSKILS